MVDFSSIGATSTPLTFQELSVPKIFDESEAVLDKLKGVNGSDIGSVYSLLASVSTEIQATKRSDLSGLWERVEKKLYNNKEIKSNAETDVEKLNTLLGMFFTGLKEIDKTNNVELTRSFSSMFSDLKFFVEKRFVSNYTGKDRLQTSRSLNITQNFLTRVVKRYDTDIENELLPGPKIGS